MANAIYPKCKQAMWQAGISAASGTVKVALIDTGAYTYSIAHDFWNDASAGLVGTAATVGSKTFTDGVFDHADAAPMWSSVTGSSVEALIWYEDTAGADTTDPLYVYMDTGITGMPFTPSASNVNLTLNASGVCAL